jgi:hypothetical protein
MADGFYRGLLKAEMHEDLRCPSCGAPTLAYAGLDLRTIYFACASCKYQYVTPKSELRKGIIYLDQWAISLMHKAADGREDLDAWRDILKRLSNLVRNQVVVCPHCTYHQIDSDLKPEIADDLGELFRHLGHDVTFHHPQVTEMNQIMCMVNAFIEKTPVAEVQFDYRQAISSNAHCPSDDLSIGVPPLRLTPEQVKETLAIREGALAQWDTVCAAASTEECHDVEGLARRHVLRYGQEIFRDYVTFLFRRERMWTGQEPFDIGYLHATSATSKNQLAYAICDRFQREGDDLESALRRTQGFLASEYFAEAPAAKIAGFLMAAINRKTVLGQPPRKAKASDIGDINLIRLYLPYSNVMLVDNEFRALATESPVKLHERYNCRLFSSKTRGEFTSWLDQREWEFAAALVRRDQVGEIPDCRTGAAITRAFLRATSRTDEGGAKAEG